MHGIDKDSVDIICGNLSVENGSAETYIELIEFIETHDISLYENYEYLKTKIDIDNYTDYIIFELYFGNSDWPPNNVKMWRPQTPDGKWKWLFYDLDASCDNHSLNNFIRLFDKNNQALFFNEIIKNQEFKNQFLNRFLYHLKNTFKPELLSQTIDKFVQLYKPEVAEHILRWGNPFDMEHWEESYNHLYIFFNKRPCIIKEQIIDFFDLDTLKFDCSYYISPSIDSLFPFEESEIVISPNPCSESLTISIETNANLYGDITIFTNTGQQVYHEKFKSNRKQINIRHFSNGIYFIHLNCDNIIKVKKLLINK
ncbi:MAG: T9SS type A sorting domain-containing protein [Bacteroidetes bacterium]|nr:T9SS type A sorting domain-containing protein [Bacteroidota bacterium]MBT6686477.1 T9SS type A sorting domain-containing protein [Bacteroidota bacterium]MBT7142706.1 T9SS type A sorting domain-containing protein [Bacteroidota bacterium]MBT7491158.1 T9SS type A sorting domain-containing protein [Bacteroidota bacterium]